jgi:hypothetical protein
MTPASLDELLKEWEAEAKICIDSDLNTALPDFSQRILSLIAVVRKQRKSLEFIREQFENSDPEKSSIEIDYLIIGRVREALTEAERILLRDSQKGSKG